MSWTSFGTRLVTRGTRRAGRAAGASWPRRGRRRPRATSWTPCGPSSPRRGRRRPGATSWTRCGPSLPRRGRRRQDARSSTRCARSWPRRGRPRRRSRSSTRCARRSSRGTRRRRTRRPRDELEARPRRARRGPRERGGASRPRRPPRRARERVAARDELDALRASCRARAAAAPRPAPAAARARHDLDALRAELADARARPPRTMTSTRSAPSSPTPGRAPPQRGPRSAPSWPTPGRAPPRTMTSTRLRAELADATRATPPRIRELDALRHEAAADRDAIEWPPHRPWKTPRRPLDAARDEAAVALRTAREAGERAGALDRDAAALRDELAAGRDGVEALRAAASTGCAIATRSRRARGDGGAPRRARRRPRPRRAATEAVDALRAEVRRCARETAAARTQADLANAVAERAKLDDGRVQALQADVKSALAQVEELRKRSAAPAPDRTPRRRERRRQRRRDVPRDPRPRRPRERHQAAPASPCGRDAEDTAERAARPGFDDDPQPLAILGLDGRFRELNPGFARLVGYQEDHSRRPHGLRRTTGTTMLSSSSSWRSSLPGSWRVSSCRAPTCTARV